MNSPHFACLGTCTSITSGVVKQRSLVYMSLMHITLNQNQLMSARYMLFENIGMKKEQE